MNPSARISSHSRPRWRLWVFPCLWIFEPRFKRLRHQVEFTECARIKKQFHSFFPGCQLAGNMLFFYRLRAATLGGSRLNRFQLSASLIFSHFATSTF